MTNIINKVIKNWTEYQIYASWWAAIAVDSELSTTSTNPAQNKVITTAINSKAADNAVVKLTWNQTVAWTKTFSTSPVVPSKNSAASSSNKTVIATEAQVALKQDALTLPSSPTSWHIVTWWANNKTLADWWAAPAWTITSVKMNWSTVASSWEADLGTVITSHQNIKTINWNTITWTGNVQVWTLTAETVSSWDSWTNYVIKTSTTAPAAWTASNIITFVIDS